MTIKEATGILEAENLTPNTDTEREIRCGYACDLLSWVMSHGAQGMAWITVQTHMNVVAVATLMDMSAIIVPEGIRPGDDVVAKAAGEGIAILSSKKTAYELSGLLWAHGVGVQ